MLPQNDPPTNSGASFSSEDEQDNAKPMMETQNLPAFPPSPLAADPLFPQSPVHLKRSRRIRVRRIKQMSRADMAAEEVDPYVQGWEAAENLDDPTPCPYVFTDGLHYKLWRNGFSDRVDEHIANARRYGGINASVMGSNNEGVVIIRTKKY